MYNLPVLGSNKTVEAALPEKVKSHVLYEVVRWQLASRRRGTAATKTRGMVNFTTKKMYAQKHTGRARHGDYGAPIFVGVVRFLGRSPATTATPCPRKCASWVLRWPWLTALKRASSSWWKTLRA